MGDPAVEESEALSLAGFTGQLPQNLHTAGVHHLSEERWGGWSCVEKKRNEELEEESRRSGNTSGSSWISSDSLLQKKNLWQYRLRASWPPQSGTADLLPGVSRPSGRASRWLLAPGWRHHAGTFLC